MAKQEDRADSYFGWLDGDAEIPEGGTTSRVERADTGSIMDRLRLLDDDAGEGGGNTVRTEGLQDLGSVFSLDPPAKVSGSDDSDDDGPLALDGGAGDPGVVSAGVDRLSLLDDPGAAVAEVLSDSMTIQAPDVDDAEAAEMALAPQPEADPTPERPSEEEQQKKEQQKKERETKRARKAKEAAKDVGAQSSASTDGKPTWEQEKRYERLKALVDENPEAPDSLIRLGSLCQEIGRVQEAVGFFRRASRLEPGNPFVRRKLTELGDVSGVFRQATATLRRELPRGMRYPFQGRHGRSVLFAAALLAGSSAVVLQFQPWIGWPLIVLAMIGLLGYLSRVVSLTMRGATAPPDWPDFYESTATAPRALATTLGCFLLPLLLAVVGVQLLPNGLASLLATDDVPARYAEYGATLEKSFRDTGDKPALAKQRAESELAAMGLRRPPVEEAGIAPSVLFGLAGLGLLLGIFYYPMAFLIATLFEAPKPALNYAFGAKQIAKFPRDYAVLGALAAATAGAVVSTFALAGWATTTLIPIPIFGTFVWAAIGGALSVYLLLIMGFLLGRFYKLYETRFGWFIGGGF